MARPSVILRFPARIRRAHSSNSPTRFGRSNILAPSCANLVNFAFSVNFFSTPMHAIPVIDLFAGPGGLGEGFASIRDRNGEPTFDIRLSIEKDPIAHRTLELRSFFRSFRDNPPADYYRYLRGELNREELFSDKRFSRNRTHATEEAWCLELCEANRAAVGKRVKAALHGADEWVLIGGPPCQAYSLAGRSRMRSADPELFEQDKRHFLYREYLRIIAEHQPPVFIMENVKGLLSSKMDGSPIFERILSDLTNPNGGKLHYRIVPLLQTEDLFERHRSDFLIRSEQFGIPQRRHRVILCGIRDDIRAEPGLLRQREPVTVDHALAGMPKLRSTLSKETDSHSAWKSALDEAATIFEKRTGASFHDISVRMRQAAKSASRVKTTGSRFAALDDFDSPETPAARDLHKWVLDKRLNGVSNHEARGHMRSDIHRYLFSASYAAIRDDTPRLRDFPRFLLPAHENAFHAALGSDGAPFEDRFRVQLRHEPATTVVSHISKDGHYYIHPDPAQCRSLTVREAARLQTFPDNYFFEGNRTMQYHQVGNAVPPLLARQIAEIVRDLIG